MLGILPAVLDADTGECCVGATFEIEFERASMAERGAADTIRLGSGANPLPTTEAQLSTKHPTRSRRRLLLSVFASSMALYALGGVAGHLLRCTHLQRVSSTAVQVGAMLLPSDRKAAIDLTRACISAGSDRYLAIVDISADNRSLTLQVEERLPLYLMLLTGEFASSDIVITARAIRESSTTLRLRI